MKTIIIFLLILTVFNGCTRRHRPAGTLAEFITGNRQRIEELTKGMRKKSVLLHMGRESFQLGSETILNPYRSQTLQGKEGAFEVLYYYADIVEFDGKVSEDELLPLVFENGRLVGWGPDFLKELEAQHALRVLPSIE